MRASTQKASISSWRGGAISVMTLLRLRSVAWMQTDQESRLGRSDSGHADRDLVISRRAVREGLGDSGGLQLAGAVGGARRDRVLT